MAIPEQRARAPKTAEQTGIPEQSTLGQWEVLVQDGEGKQTFKCRQAEWENSGEVCVSGGAGVGGLAKERVCSGGHKVVSIRAFYAQDPFRHVNNTAARGAGCCGSQAA